MVDYDGAADRASNELLAWMNTYSGTKIRTPEEAQRLVTDFNVRYLRFQAAVRDAKVALDSAETNFRIVRDRLAAKYYELMADRR